MRFLFVSFVLFVSGCTRLNTVLVFNPCEQDKAVYLSIDDERLHWEELDGYEVFYIDWECGIREWYGKSVVEQLETR